MAVIRQPRIAGSPESFLFSYALEPSYIVHDKVTTEVV